MQEEFKILQTHLNNLLKQEDLTISNVVEFTLQLMKVAETFETLPGPDKKNLILNVLAQYVDENVGASKVLVMELINFTLPPMIDVMIALDKSELHIQLKNVCDKVRKGCRPKCCKN